MATSPCPWPRPRFPAAAFQPPSRLGASSAAAGTRDQGRRIKGLVWQEKSPIHRHSSSIAGNSMIPGASGAAAKTQVGATIVSRNVTSARDGLTVPVRDCASHPKIPLLALCAPRACLQRRAQRPNLAQGQPSPPGNAPENNPPDRTFRPLMDGNGLEESRDRATETNRQDYRRALTSSAGINSTSVELQNGRTNRR